MGYYKTTLSGRFVGHNRTARIPHKPRHMRCAILNCHGGEGEIRTHGNLAATPDFESGAFDHSATSPWSFIRSVRGDGKPVFRPSQEDRT